MEKRREFLKLGLAGAASLAGASVSLGASVAPQNPQNLRPFPRYTDKKSR